MRRGISLRAALVASASFLLAAAGIASAQEVKTDSGPLTGAWQCISRGGPEGEIPFTLDLSQDSEKVTGSVSSAQGGMEITAASFKKETLEIHLDTPDGSYLLTARLSGGRLTAGQTTLDGKAHGSWEGKKGTAAEGRAGD